MKVMVAMYVTCVKPLSSNPQLGVRADRTGRSGRGIVLLYLRQITRQKFSNGHWPTAVATLAVNTLSNLGPHPEVVPKAS